MSHVIDILFLDANEMVFHIDDHSWLANTSSTRHDTYMNDTCCMENINDTYWRPSDPLRKTLRSLYENDYAQFSCLYCSRMVYPHSAKWIARDEPLAILSIIFSRNTTHYTYVQLTHIKNCGMQYLQI